MSMSFYGVFLIIFFLNRVTVESQAPQVLLDPEDIVYVLF